MYSYCIRVGRCPAPVCVSEVVTPSIRGHCLVHLYTHTESSDTVQWISRTSLPTCRPRAPRMHRGGGGKCFAWASHYNWMGHSAMPPTCTLSPQRPRAAPTHGRRDGAPLGLTWGVRLTSNWRLTSPPGGALTPETTAVHASNDAGCPSHHRRVSVMWWTSPG